MNIVEQTDEVTCLLGDGKLSWPWHTGKLTGSHDIFVQGPLNGAEKQFWGEYRFRFLEYFFWRMETGKGIVFAFTQRKKMAKLNWVQKRPTCPVLS